VEMIEVAVVLIVCIWSVAVLIETIREVVSD